MKAMGMLRSRTATAATIKRTIPGFAPASRRTKSTRPGMIPGTRTRKPSKPRRTRRTRSGTAIRPVGVRRRHGRAMTVMGDPLLVHPAHDRVEAGHDRHRVGDEVARQDKSPRPQGYEAPVGEGHSE